MPDEAVAAVLLDALDDVFDGVDMVRTHHQELLLAGDEDHVAADHLAEDALGEELVGKRVEATDFPIVFVGVFVDGQETLVGVEGEVAGVVVGEVIGGVAIADDEELDEAEERARVAVAGVVLVIDDLLDGPAGIDAEGFEFDLDDGHAVDEDEHVVAVVAVVGVDAELVDDFESVFAPVVDVYEGEVERGAVVTREGVAAAERVGGGEDVGGRDFFEQARELGVGERDVVEGLEFLAEVGFERGAVADVRTVFVLQAAKFFDKLFFKLAFGRSHYGRGSQQRPRRRGEAVIVRCTGRCGG